MQTTSQGGAAPEKTRKGKGHIRQPHEGNRLWAEYCELGRTRLAEFKAKLKAASIPFNTFTYDTASTRRLGSIATERMQVYRDFFLESGVDLFAVIESERQPEATTEAAQ